MRKLLSRTLLLASILPGTVLARVEALEIPSPRVSAEGKWLLPPCEGREYLPIWTGCVGTRTEANGDRYVGEFWGGLSHGHGTLFFANGDRYVGDCEYAQPHGQGTLIYANGDQYVGEFWMAQRHGQGSLTDVVGIVREGVWVDGVYAHTIVSATFNRKGNEYRDGIGVSQDYKAALKWYRLAAERENRDAMLNIAHLYHQRKVIDPIGYVHQIMDWWNEVDSRHSRSRIKAYMWADLAGDRLRDAIAEQLTPAEIKEAQKLSAEWWIHRSAGPGL